MKLVNRAAVAAGLVVGLLLGTLGVPVAANAASGSFDSVKLSKVADGYSFANNPVDPNNSNGIVGVRDFVGFEIQATTTGAVNGATMTLKKPSCWVWDTSVDQNLTFNLNGGQTTGSVAHPDADTVVVTWTQAANGVVLTQPFRAKAGEGCADGSTWTPELTVTDDSGTQTQTLPAITVRSVASADISLQAVGAPSIQASHWFAGPEFGPGGAGPALVQRWDIRLQPDTLSKVGYADPNGNITFTVAYSGPRSSFELPRNNSTQVPSGGGCWAFVGPNPYNNNQYYPSSSAQTVTITMKKNPACEAMLADQGNVLQIYSFTPQKVLEDDYGCQATLSAHVAAGSWVDANGRPIADSNPNNNDANRALVCQTVEYGYQQGASYFTPKVAGADLVDAYPWRSTAQPIVRTPAAAKWALLADINNLGYIGKDGTFTSETIYVPEEPALTNVTSFHLWDPTKQRLDVAHLDGAVLGAVAPSSSSAATDPAMDTRAFPPSSYTVQCTVDFTGANSGAAPTMTWADCDSLDPAKISGLRFLRAGSFTGENFGVNFPNSKLLFSQVPMIAVGQIGERLPTITRWLADEFASKPARQNTVNTEIIGNVLRISKDAAESQAMPEDELHYTIKPTVAPGAGTFVPYAVDDLRVVDTLDIGVLSVDVSNVDPFWTVTQTPADLGPDGVPYTADDVSGIVLTFTPAGAVRTDTVLPPITYSGKLGVLLPPQAAPYNATVKNTARVSATGMDPEVAAGVSPKRHSDTATVLAGTPQAAFFSKQLISDPEIEVEDVPAAWRVQWVNYNNYDLGQGRFVDVFPFDGDGRGSAFSGTAKLASIGRVGAAKQPGTVFELTEAAPAGIGASPATGTSWVVVDPADPSGWPAHPTAIRVTVPNIQASTQGYGAVDLGFEVDGQVKNDIYHNDASGTVQDPVQGRTINLGEKAADPVKVVASSIAGVAWVDRNSDGVRQGAEALLPGITVRLFRDGDRSTAFRTATTDANGAYRFTQLHSSDYQVVFDADELRAKGYRLTDQGAGTDRTIDSDADVDTGEVDELALPRSTDVAHLDAGVIPVGLQAAVDADASLTRTFGWNIEKTAVNRDSLAVDPATGATRIDYAVTTTEGKAVDSNARLSGTVTVTNPSDTKTYTFTATAVADGTGLSCTVTGGSGRQIAPGAQLTLPYSCTGAPGSDLDRTVTVTVAASDLDPITGQPVEPATASVDTSYRVSEVNKTVNVTDTATIAGATTDRSFGPYTWSAEGTEHAEQYSVDATVPAGDCLGVDNTAKIIETGQSDTESVNACLPVDLTVGKNVVTGLQRSYGWSLSKRLTNPTVQLDADGKATLEYAVTLTEGAKTDAAWTMNGTVTVQNPNRYKSVQASLSDTPDIGGGADCIFAAGATVTLAAGETRALAYSCSFTSEPAYAGTNTAKVTWRSDVPGSDRALTVDRAAEATAEIRESDWNLTEFRKTVSVRDLMKIGGKAAPARDFGPYTWSAEGTTHVERYSVPVQVDPGTCLAVDNGATIRELGVTASTQHTLCRQAPLVVADTATASKVRVFGWAIDKRLDNRDDIARDASPESVDARYSVTVTERGFTDSAHQLSGTVLLTNPNTFRALTVSVQDLTDIDGLECRFDGAQKVLVPASGTARVPYRCTGAPAAGTDAEHLIRVTGNGIDPIDHGTAVKYRTSEIDRKVTVSDDRYRFDPAWRITWSAAGTEHRREYSIPVRTEAGSCQVFTNTASLGPKGPASTASFEICAPRGGGGTGQGLFDRLSTTGAGGWGLMIGTGALLAAAGALLVLRARRRPRA
ncbi:MULTISPECIES: SdrD B-like domain-containing protein [unclassified Leucobacter]|uniref:SdrD B-like domain-containing protein n=1 Tax=unclassified Leucobacter TaxID=2621730 RepID=UPI0030170627